MGISVEVIRAALQLPDHFCRVQKGTLYGKWLCHKHTHTLRFTWIHLLSLFNFNNYVIMSEEGANWATYGVNFVWFLMNWLKLALCMALSTPSHPTSLEWKIDLSSACEDKGGTS